MQIIRKGRLICGSISMTHCGPPFWAVNGETKGLGAAKCTFCPGLLANWTVALAYMAQLAAIGHDCLMTKPISHFARRTFAQIAAIDGVHRVSVPIGRSAMPLVHQYGGHHHRSHFPSQLSTSECGQITRLPCQYIDSPGFARPFSGTTLGCICHWTSQLNSCLSLGLS